MSQKRYIFLRLRLVTLRGRYIAASFVAIIRVIFFFKQKGSNNCSVLIEKIIVSDFRNNRYGGKSL